MTDEDNARTLAAFDVITKGQDWKGSLSAAIRLLCHIMDAGERLDNGQPRRIEVTFKPSTRDYAYKVICEEVTRDAPGESPWRFSDKMQQEVFDILGRYCGETNQNEGLVETLKRKLRELEVFKMDEEKFP